MTADPTPHGLEAVSPVFRRILVQGAVLVVGLAVVAGLVGLLVAGVPGLLGGLIGAVMSVVFLGLTAASVLVAIRVSKGQMISGAFFGIIMGTFLLKFVLFIVVLVALKGRPWVDTPVMAIAIIVGVVGSLVIDVATVARSRVPIDVRLPGDRSPGDRLPGDRSPGDRLPGDRSPDHGNGDPRT